MANARPSCRRCRVRSRFHGATRWSPSPSRPGTASSWRGSFGCPTFPRAAPRPSVIRIPATVDQGPPDPLGDPQRLARRGFAVLCFDFRGVMNFGGTYGGGLDRSGTCSPPSTVRATRRRVSGGRLRLVVRRQRRVARGARQPAGCGARPRRHPTARRATSSCPRSPVATDCVGYARRYCSWPVSTTSFCPPGVLRTLATEFRRASVGVRRRHRPLPLEA